jgi:N utilization substance protein A
LQPAEVEQVILCKMLGRGIVLVREDQLSLAIGRRGQNVRLASKLSGWDIEIMTQEELAQAIERAVVGFSSITGIDEELANRLVEEGFLSYDDLSIIEPDALMAMGGLSEEEANTIVEQAEERAEVAEAAAADARREKREQERLSEMAAEAGLKLAPMDEGEGGGTDEAGETGTAALDTDVSDNGEENMPVGDGADVGRSAADSAEEQAESKT